jgi:hypothetical protein
MTSQRDRVHTFCVHRFFSSAKSFKDRKIHLKVAKLMFETCSGVLLVR